MVDNQSSYNGRVTYVDLLMVVDETVKVLLNDSSIHSFMVYVVFVVFITLWLLNSLY